jgi:hypothetical protein
LQLLLNQQRETIQVETRLLMQTARTAASGDTSGPDPRILLLSSKIEQLEKYLPDLESQMLRMDREREELVQRKHEEVVWLQLKLNLS